MPEGAAFKLIGLGGVGGIVARHLAVFLAALGCETRLVLIDGDAFEPANRSRMLFHRAGNKAAVVRDELLERFADTPLCLTAVEEFVSKENLQRLVRNGDTVLLAVDNHATRKLVNDHCARLPNVCLVSGGNDGVGADSSGRVRRGTFGNAQIFVRRNGRDLTPPLTHHHAEIAHPTDAHPADKSCTDLITSVPQILFVNLMAASAILNSLWLQLCGRLHYGEVVFDIAEGLMRPIPLAHAESRGAAGVQRGKIGCAKSET